MRRLSSLGQTAMDQGPSVAGIAGAGCVRCQNRGSSQKLLVFLPACIASFQVGWRWTKESAHQVCPGTISSSLAPSGYFYLRKWNSISQKNILCQQLLNSASKAISESWPDTVYITCILQCLKEPLFSWLFLQQVVYPGAVLRVLQSTVMSHLSLNTRTTTSFARVCGKILSLESPMTDIPLSSRNCRLSPSYSLIFVSC